MAVKKQSDIRSSDSNRLAYAGTPYTLRQTPVSPLIVEARKAGLQIIDGMLGNPVAHGMKPYPGFKRAVADAVLEDASHNYTDSFGNADLRAMIRKVWFGGHDVEMYIGAGVSDLNDLFMRWALSGQERNGIVIPAATYILYFFDAAINGAAVQKVKLTPDGQVDITRLADTIDKNTKVVVVTTTGNPLGTSMSEQTAKDILAIVNAKERQFGHPIYPVFDIMYEGFRHDRIELDPIAIAESTRRTGPTIVVDSLSKRKMASPGSRLGWMAVNWPKGEFPKQRADFFEELNALFLPRLGRVSLPVQLGLLKVLQGMDAGAAHDYAEWDRSHTTEANRRVRSMLTGLAEIGGVIFHDCYYNYPGDRSSGIAYGRADNDFYLIFGFAGDQVLPGQTRDVEMPSARKFAQFCIDRSLPIPGLTPFDAFLPPDDRGKGHDLMRIVALQNDQNRLLFLECVRAYAEHFASKS